MFFDHTPATRVVMGALSLTGCVFRSADKVDALGEERDAPGWGPDMVAWCLQAHAAHRAQRLGWRWVEKIEAPATAVRFLAGLKRKTRDSTSSPAGFL